MTISRVKTTLAGAIAAAGLIAGAAPVAQAESTDAGWQFHSRYESEVTCETVGQQLVADGAASDYQCIIGIVFIDLYIR